MHDFEAKKMDKKVAIKQIRDIFKSEEATRAALREIKILKLLKGHNNVSLKYLKRILFWFRLSILSGF